MRLTHTLVAVASIFSLVGCQTSTPTEPTPAATEAPTNEKQLGSGVFLNNFDRSVRPQDDFYRFVNGGWLTRTEIPGDRSNYGSFTILQEQAEGHVRTLLEEAAAKTDRQPGSDAQYAGDFYTSFMNEAAIEQQGLKPLQEELSRIEQLETLEDLSYYIGRLQRLGVAKPFAYAVGIDEKNSTQYVSYLFQNGLGMPDRDYYLSKDAKLQSVREKYQQYLRDLLGAAGLKNADANAQHIYALEEKLAQASWTRVQSRDAEKTYNRHTLAEAKKLAPNIDWRAFLEGAQAQKADVLVISQPSYIAGLSQAMKQAPMSHWREYFRFALLDAYAPYLPQRFVQLHFDFHDRTVSGVTEMRPRWRRGVLAVESAIGELVGRMYVERHFSPEAKRRVEELVSNLKTAYAQGIDQLEWMSADTKKQAHAKLERFTTKIGYPDKWRDWSALEVKPNDLIGNDMRAAAVTLDRQIEKLGGPIDRTEWLMTPQTVNAYYYPPANEIVFPAAILQPPFFDVNAEDAVNYGGIGAVIGHEISHGFDDQGRRYDGEGNLRDWWTEADNTEFQRRAKGLVDQYAKYSPVAGTNVNGELTLGENIADLAGLAMAHRAYKLSLDGKPAPTIDGFTGDQRFFIGWAQVWARKYREDEMRKRLLTDPHSPSEYRANGIVANNPEFYAAFEVKPGDKLYRAPEQHVRIW